MTGPILDRAAVAARLRIKPDSVTRYVNRGQCPPPDGRVGRAPWWFAATIEEWLPARPGPGRPRKPTATRP